MKNIKIISLILSLILIITAIPLVAVAEDTASTQGVTNVKDEIPYIDGVTDLAGYGHSKAALTSAEAAAAGVPEGYTGEYVLKLTNATNISFMLDLRQTICKDVKVKNVESVTFRVWAPSTIGSLRIRSTSGTSWQVNKPLETPNQWTDLVVTDMSVFVEDGNGYFSPFCFAFRGNSENSNPVVYFDSITVKLKENVEPDTETETLYYTFADNMGKEEIPYGEKATGTSWYGYKNFKMMNESQAAAAGVPEGYSGWVLAIDPEGATNVSIGLDFTNIKVADIEKITIRVWAPAGTKTVDGVRITNKGESWIMTAPCTQGEWNEIVLDEDKNFYPEAGNSFNVFDDGNGYCKAVNFGFRGATGTAYIDHINIELKEGAVPPTQETETATEITTETVTETETEAPTLPEVETVDPESAKVEIPYTTEDSTYSKYGYSEMKVYATSNAVAAGIPEGYTGDYVMALTRKTNVSITMDLRQTVCKDVKIEDVESVSFKVWIPTTMDLRIKTLSPISNGEWAYIKSYNGNAWHTVTVTNMEAFVDDGNGYFSPFAFTFRDNTNTAQDYTVYFDGVTVKMKDPDPVKTHYTFEEGMGKEEIPYGANDSVGMSYGYSNFMMMDETQADMAGVPEGYSGWVLALGHAGDNTSIGLDLTNIQTRDIENISFRVWCPTGTKQTEGSGGVRLSGDTKNTWNMLYSPTAIGEWIDIVLEKDSFASFDYDGDGYCDPMNFCFRGATSVGYIDHITVNLKAPDVEPPVITYNGETVINTSEGREFVLDLTAHDAYYDVDITPEYVWSDGALDSDGKLVKGTHTCTVKATDEAGNFAEITLTVNVSERDVEAPVFDWTPAYDSFFAMEGALPFIAVNATDNVDEIKAVLTWSEGALDIYGRLTAGEHTLTVSATDLSGNRNEFVITFTVVSERPTVGEIIQDS